MHLSNHNIQLVRSTFAQCYNALINIIQRHPVDIEVRGNALVYELILPRLVFDVPCVSVYSSPISRATPIRFCLAEFLWIISGSDELAMINRFNGRMSMFSDDKAKLYGAYGLRLGDQIHHAIEKIRSDKYSRQAYCDIHRADDIAAKSKDIPCNTALQFIVRNDRLYMTVISRSSDFVTGMSIDAVHWQILYHCVLNSIRKYHPLITWGTITYQLTSLHVYRNDLDAISTWVTDERLHNYDHTITIRDDYYSMSNKSLNDFPMCETLADMLVLYNLSFHERNTLQDIAKYKNQLAQR